MLEQLEYLAVPCYNHGENLSSAINQQERFTLIMSNEKQNLSDTLLRLLYEGSEYENVGDLCQQIDDRGSGVDIARMLAIEVPNQFQRLILVPVRPLLSSKLRQRLAENRLRPLREELIEITNRH